MAFQNRINAIFGKDTLVVYDTTGVFDSGYNIGGYGAQTDGTRVPQLISTCVLEITPPGATVAISYTVNSLPNVNGEGIEVIPSNLGLTSFVAGIWTINMIITFTDSVVFETGDCKFKNDCALRKCISDRIKQITPNQTLAYDKETFRLKMLLDASDDAMCDGDYDRVNDLVQELSNKCDCDCGC